MKVYLSATLLMLLAGSGAGARGVDGPRVEERAVRRSVTRLLRSVKGEPLGSAVVVGSAANGLWLVTSRHVVETVEQLCVVAMDGESRPARVLPFREPASRLALDVAVLWQPNSPAAGNTPPPRVVATWADPMPVAAAYPVVTASGYQTPSDQSGHTPRYSESTGLLLPLLPTAIEGGFDLTSSVTVVKGMSGGGLFHGARLMGINGTHAHPLWPGVLLSGSGQPLDPALNAQLEQVSLGVSATAIKRLLQDAVKPNDQDLRGMEGLLHCRTHLESPGTF